MVAVTAAVRLARPAGIVVACGYADYDQFGGLSPADLVAAAAEADADYVMLDTYQKQGASLFDCLSLPALRWFVHAARERELQVALAGSLGLADLEHLVELQVDIIGVRGALCSEGKRTAEIDAALTAEFVKAARGLYSPASQDSQRPQHPQGPQHASLPGRFKVSPLSLETQDE